MGLNTVELGGKYFKVHVSDGEKVKKGQLLLEFDMEQIREAGYSLVTPVIVTESGDRRITPAGMGPVKAGDPALTLTLQNDCRTDSEV